MRWILTLLFVAVFASVSVAPQSAWADRLKDAKGDVKDAKEDVKRAYETTLSEGIRFERRVFHSIFAFEDQKEGMAAFTEKRKPNFKHR